MKQALRHITRLIFRAASKDAGKPAVPEAQQSPSPVVPSMPSFPLGTVSGLTFLDLRERIRAIDPRYLETQPLLNPFDIRLNCLGVSRRENRVYAVLSGAYVFYSEDGFQTLFEVPEVNRIDGELVPVAKQSIDAVVETVTGTGLLLGRDYRPVPGSSGWSSQETGVTWRKPAGEALFSRHALDGPAWMTSKAGNANAGFFGPDQSSMVCVSIYAAPPAHLYFSLDDGLTFRRQDLSRLFAEHVHEVYLALAAPVSRPARLWVSGGDDPSGERSGVVTFSRLDAEGNLSGQEWVLRESPGYRLVGLAGNGKHVFVGNESLAGGVLKILDNAETIAGRDYESVLGKERHDYHQFRSLVATDDGILVSGTDSYRFTGDTVRADSGGYLYISNDLGAAYTSIALGATWITSLVYDGQRFFMTVSSNRESGADSSVRALSVLRLPKPDPFTDLSGPLAVKVLAADSSKFYKMAGYAVHPEPVLEPGETTFRVNLSSYSQLALHMETGTAGRITVEGTLFETWKLTEYPWSEVFSFDAGGAGRWDFILPPLAAHQRFLRVRNSGSEPITLRLLALSGRKA